MPPDRWTTPAGNPAAAGGAHPDGRPENEGRTKGDAPGATPAEAAAGSPGLGETSLVSGAPPGAKLAS